MTPCQSLSCVLRWCTHVLSIMLCARCRGTKLHVYRYSPAVEILVPLWASGLHGDAPLQDVCTAWFEVWGIEEVSTALAALNTHTHGITDVTV